MAVGWNWDEGYHCPTQPGLHANGEGSMLTVAGSSSPYVGSTVITDEALALITHVNEVTGLSQPPGTYPATATAIQNQRGPRRTMRWDPGAEAWSPAQLSTDLRRQNHQCLPNFALIP